MPYTEDGSGHFTAEVIDHLQQISGMIEPGCWDTVNI
jgi:hypothetical protein